MGRVGGGSLDRGVIEEDGQGLREGQVGPGIPIFFNLVILTNP